jgi:hypothetical protein
MLKKIVLLALLAFTLAANASAAISQQNPIPPCNPCGGDGN